eukprot:9324661-Karenia_brevis.AAC.1
MRWQCLTLSVTRGVVPKTRHRTTWLGSKTFSITRIELHDFSAGNVEERLSSIECIWCWATDDPAGPPWVEPVALLTSKDCSAA